MQLISTLPHVVLLLLIALIYQQTVAQADIVQQAPRATPTKTLSTTPAISAPTTTDPGLIGLPTLSAEPQVVVYPANCQSEGKWYIQGGFHFTSFNQLFSLDLTVPWNTSSAPWVEYPDAPLLSTQNCLFAPKDGVLRFNDISRAFNTNISSSPVLTGNPVGPVGSVLAFFGNEDKTQPLISILNMTTGTWHYNASSVNVPVRNPGIFVPTTSLDGRIYMRGGHQSSKADTMDIYDPRKDSLISIPILLANDTVKSIVSGGTGVPPAQWYSTCWSSRRSSILYFGGRIGLTSNYTSPEIIEYKPSTNAWAIVPVTGTGPTAREDACMVTDKDNNRVVVFGGQNVNGSLSDIYILDMKTLVWTRGQNAGVSRLGMACALYNDGFLTWGGATETFLVGYPDENPTVFNLTTMRWTDRYNQKDSVDGGLEGTNTGGGSKLGLILGLSISFAAIIALACGVYLFRREKRKTVQDYDRILYGKSKDTRQDPSQGSSSHSGTTHPNGHNSIGPAAPPRAALASVSSTPQPKRQAGLLTARGVNWSSGGRYSGSEGSWQDDVSVRTATSGKYIQETDDESPPRRSRRRQKQQDQPNSQLGHKIEMSSMGPQGDGTGDITTSLNIYGDPTKISPASPSHAVAPYAAPSAPPNPNYRRKE
ncbi:MAG: hypothetical protein J3R72DRAFT_450291 [Linnemannia gamsii]|nr:MAG: hypothetical protein J3R72DRAFT_450291 [Linnemannia gamsii]